MDFAKRSALPGIFGIVLFVLAGCGGSSTASNHPTATAAPAATRAPTAPFVEVATVSIGGADKHILTTAPGLTLYYNSDDTAKTVTCQGGCATVWHPFYFAGSGAPLAPRGLTGTLSLLATTGGNQIEYNGHLMYTYVQDITPGQTKGQGIQGKWQVVTTDLPSIG